MIFRRDLSDGNYMRHKVWVGVQFFADCGIMLYLGRSIIGNGLL